MFLELHAAEVRQNKTHRGGRRRDPAKETAAMGSWILLELFGRPQALTERAVWHKLAATLFGYANVRLFDFDYLRLAQRELHGRLAPLAGLLRRV